MAEAMLRIALDEEGKRISIDDVPKDIEARHAHSYSCPLCGARLVARKGEVMTHHFAHAAGESCDEWSSGMTPWHSGWQDAFDRRYQEAIFDGYDDEGKAHRADIFLDYADTVIEFQHSPMSRSEFDRRCRFYTRKHNCCIWVFDARGKADNIFADDEYEDAADIESILALPFAAKSTHIFRWKNAPSWLRLPEQPPRDVCSLATMGVSVLLAVSGSDNGADGLLLEIVAAREAKDGPTELEARIWRAEDWLRAVKEGRCLIQQRHVVAFHYPDGSTKTRIGRHGGYLPEAPYSKLPEGASGITWSDEAGNDETLLEDDRTLSGTYEWEKVSVTLYDADDIDSRITISGRYGQPLSSNSYAMEAIGDKVLLCEEPRAPRQANTSIPMQPKAEWAKDGDGAIVFAGDASSMLEYRCPHCGRAVRKTKTWRLDGTVQPNFAHVDGASCNKIDNEPIRRMLMNAIIEESSDGKLLLPAVSARDCHPHASRYANAARVRTVLPATPRAQDGEWTWKDALPDTSVQGETAYSISEVERKYIQMPDGEICDYLVFTLERNGKTSQLALFVSAQESQIPDLSIAEAFAEEEMSVIHVDIEFDLPTNLADVVKLARYILYPKNLHIQDNVYKSKREWLYNKAASNYARKRLHLAFGVSNDERGYYGRKFALLLRDRGVFTEYADVDDMGDENRIDLLSGVFVTLIRKRWEAFSPVRNHYEDISVYIAEGEPVNERSAVDHVEEFEQELVIAARQNVEDKRQKLRRR